MFLFVTSISIRNVLSHFSTKSADIRNPEILWNPDFAHQWSIDRSVGRSVTRFDEISPLCPIFKTFCQSFEGLFSFGQNFQPTLTNILPKQQFFSVLKIQTLKTKSSHLVTLLGWCIFTERENARFTFRKPDGRKGWALESQ